MARYFTNSCGASLTGTYKTVTLFCARSEFVCVTMILQIGHLDYMARVPTTPVRPRVMVNTLLALIIGAMLGLGGALLLEYLDDTVKTPNDVQKLTGLVTLGGVVKLEGVSPDQRLVVRDTPKSAGAEAYRVLRTNLQFSSVDKPLSTLLVTSSGPGEGKSTTASNLAIAIAQSNKRVILVDADLRRPSLHRLWRLTNNVGLSTALLDKHHSVVNYLQDTDVTNLKVMTAGPIPPNPAELLSSARMQDRIATLKSMTDVLIFDTAPLLAVADASILADQVDGSVMVVGVGETRREMLVQAVQRLKNIGVQPVGVVLNKLTERKSGYYYYSYYYYASRYDDAEHGKIDQEPAVKPPSGSHRSRKTRYNMKNRRKSRKRD